MFAARDISDGEELYVNYCENHIYPIDDFPDWMVEPPEV